MVGLDSRSEKAVTGALDRLSEGATTFLVTHDLSASKSADQIFYIENGRILESGTHASLMREAQHYAALYQMQTALVQS